ncbi:hypothetical protein THAOC_15164 [Thalassiosira oceanica]|uniref:Uncharacterized protein n=1 Tax=Thalassiosira oceanica TaxID=159749 RepID=K0T125_THAOC|nr:hypothetical protein THAOC_15164 [Thalassiosira oceanica]|eukprot:EJK64132.1 hypothetical protein THAOC_15164 [Thalassiosira oceanica]
MLYRDSCGRVASASPQRDLNDRVEHDDRSVEPPLGCCGWAARRVPSSGVYVAVPAFSTKSLATSCAETVALARDALSERRDSGLGAAEGCGAALTKGHIGSCVPTLRK